MARREPRRHRDILRLHFRRLRSRRGRNARRLHAGSRRPLLPHDRHARHGGFVRHRLDGLFDELCRHSPPHDARREDRTSHRQARSPPRNAGLQRHRRLRDRLVDHHDARRSRPRGRHPLLRRLPNRERMARRPSRRLDRCRRHPHNLRLRRSRPPYLLDLHRPAHRCRGRFVHVLRRRGPRSRLAHDRGRSVAGPATTAPVASSGRVLPMASRPRPSTA